MPSQPEHPRERLRAGDETLVTILGHPITVNEKHACVLGAILGAITGAAIVFDQMTLAVVLASLSVGYAVFGRPVGRSLSHDHPAYERQHETWYERPSKPIGIKTIRHEPWWFLAPYIVLAGLALLGGLL